MILVSKSQKLQTLLHMVDGGIVDIQYYSSLYDINEFEIKLTQRTILIVIDQEYDYSLSNVPLTQIILGNYEKIGKMKEHEFFDWLRVELEKKVGEALETFEWKC